MNSDENEKGEENLSYAEKIVKQRFQHRFTIAKIGKDALKAGDAKTALQRYTDYLDILAKNFKCDILDLEPVYFQQGSKNAEKLLVSQVFYEMSRLYDLMEGEQANINASTYLDQFVRFTINQPFQSINTQLLQRHLHKSKFHNKEIYRNALTRIYKESKMCFLVSYCYSDDHPITNDLRSFKKKISNSKIGLLFIKFYYSISPKLIAFLENRKVTANIFTNFFARPVIFVTHKVLRFYA